MLRQLRSWLNGEPVPPPPKLDTVPAALAWSLFTLATRVVWDEEIRRELYPGCGESARGELDLTLTAAKYRCTFPRLVYLVCTRERVRFSTEHPVRRRWNDLVMHLEVGSERRLVRAIPPNRYNLPRSLRRPPEPVANTDTVFTYTYDEGRRGSATVHEFLRHHEIDVGVASRVEYVGVTNGLNAGSLVHLADGGVDAVRARAGDRDVMIHHLLFTPSWEPENRDGQPIIALAEDPAPDEDLHAQIHLVKEVLVDYFQPACQGDLEGERARMRQHLRELADRHPFDHVRTTITSEEWGEYYTLFSDAVAPATTQEFRVPVPPRE